MAHLEREMEMPPDKPPLPEETIAILRTWIDEGANWPSTGPISTPASGIALGNQEAIFKKAATHWSFQPVPKAEGSSLEQGPRTIDDFILTKLRSKGLQHSPRADARTLLKRFHFDLTGIPPSPEETEAFMAEFAIAPGTALAKKADELLASSGFGERWGRYWLDLARYADTQDFFPQPDLRYPFAWTYRDYVINAFNTSKPHDQFIREQIAADQIGLNDKDPTLAALGYLTVGPRFLRRQDEIINDRIDVVTRGLMGLTVACARCHDHKYDPIPTADFYALHGVFNSTEELTQLPEIEQPGVKSDPKMRADYYDASNKAKTALSTFVQELKNKAVEDLVAKPEIYFAALCEMEIKKTTDVQKLISAKTMIETALTPLGLQWNTLKRGGKWAEDPVLGPLSETAAAAPEKKTAVLEALIDKGLLSKGKAQVHPIVLAAIRDTRPKDEVELLKVYGALLENSKNTEDELLKQVSKAFFSEGGWLDLPLKEVENAHRLQAQGRKDLEKLETAISALESTHAGAPARAMAVKDKPKPVTPVIFIRGDAARRGDSVERRFLQILNPSKNPFPSQTSGRRELAEKIVSAENPLTSRVWANHIWRHLMGHPLVKTPGDFGLQAQPPTHPELLDWMAAALLQRGWSTKRLIRDIVLSETYMQRSGERPEAAAVDVDNAFLWQANRRRMDFEAMRDAMLATSAQLDLVSGGRAVNLSAEPFSGRRTVYGFVDRANLDPLFTTFDFPSPDIASTERSQTLVPQQALFALNDGFIVWQARALVVNALKAAKPGGDPDAALEWLYRRVYQRHPNQREAQLARDFLKETAGLHETNSSGSWLYGVGNADPAVPREKAFQKFAHFDPLTKRYQGGRVFPDPQFTFASLTARGGHPGANIANATIRRWIAPYAGTFNIGGEASVGKQGSGDGIRARVISSRAGLLGEWISENRAEKTELMNLDVSEGEILDFTVDCRENMNSDGYAWAPTIKLVVKPENAPRTLQTVWDAQTDFNAPPPPKLQPLEQMAHALLMTNEFLFID
ncbi:MAG: Protein of unknown function (DUF1553)/Protein of unknown function (DUF1549) [Verrucomicrobia bacterium]|nr:MAG: Protein of unknown function (DUF1553)/Protein of unknown function (DUF1549) [Verrucomicrobiota bacterium]